MWLKLLAQTKLQGTDATLLNNNLQLSPTQMAQHWRNLGWLRQIKTYRIHRQSKSWQTHCWWRYPAGRWPTPPRELIVRAQREATGNTPTPHTVMTSLEIASSFVCNDTPMQIILFHLDTQRILTAVEMQKIQAGLTFLHSRLEIEYPFHPELNPTDLRIAQLLVNGIGQSQIALQLGQSESTIRSRIAALCRRHGVPNRRMLLARLLRTIGSKKQIATLPFGATSDWSEQHASQI